MGGSKRSQHPRVVETDHRVMKQGKRLSYESLTFERIGPNVLEPEHLRVVAREHCVFTKLVLSFDLNGRLLRAGCF